MSRAGADAAGAARQAAQPFGPYAFTLTKQDFAAFALRMGRRHAMRHEQRYGLATALGLLGASLAAVFAGWAFGLVESGPALWLFPAAAAALAFGKIFTHRQILRAQNAAVFEAAGEEALYEGRRRVTLDAEGVTLEDDAGPTRTGWAQVETVERQGGLIIFWTGLAAGITLPERAFANGADIDAALAFAQERQATARGGA